MSTKKTQLLEYSFTTEDIINQATNFLVNIQPRIAITIKNYQDDEILALLNYIFYDA
ncbi:hypothetical protein OZY43_00140 [Lactobacillus sp. ESL0785]|uniref:hypothetical protein n=1 Tax=Lactobacillus sp. ESL0785 TaxID=2983232 RepID=UPI0023F79AA1|nr:hypothetical protein [Lactobacillus sp. ESL0785]WEV70892.1 hypothetical protein OZY43_00140 [Lactobacillus sp. ESL0785]